MFVKRSAASFPGLDVVVFALVRLGVVIPGRLRAPAAGVAGARGGWCAVPRPGALRLT